jgi:hypothetical protein
VNLGSSGVLIHSDIPRYLDGKAVDSHENCAYNDTIVGFEVLLAVAMESSGFWDKKSVDF